MSLTGGLQGGLQRGLQGGLGGAGGAAAWTPADLGGLLAEYDFLEGADPAVLYDLSGAGNHGTVGTGGTFSADGFTPGGADFSAVGWATTPIAGEDVGTVLVYFTTVGADGPPVVCQDPNVGTAQLLVELIGPVAQGRLYPRVRDLTTGAQLAADISAPAWPCSLGFVFDTPSRLSINGVEAVIYDAQANGSSYNLGSAPITFGSYYFAGFAAKHLYCYALIFDRPLTEAEQLQCHQYMAAQCAGRGTAATGPASLTTDLLGFVGNSLTQGLDTAEVTPAGTWSRVSSHIYGGTPANVIAKAVQSLLPLYRPNAARNYVQVWPSPNGTAADSYAQAVAFCELVRPLGWKVSLVTAISAGPPSGSAGYDSEKNALNALYDAETYGPGPGTLADVLCDLRSVSEASDDDAYLDATYFSDGLHPTSDLEDLLYPVMTAAFDAIV